MLTRILFAAVLIVGLYTGYSFWAMGQSYVFLRDAPQNQAIGIEDAPIVMIEFMDYRCPACRNTNQAVEEAVAANPDVRVVFRHMPVFGEQSIKEAQIALAAGMQGHFKDMHDILITRTEPVQDSDIEALAKQAGLDAAQLRKDMESPALNQDMIKTLHAAQRLGIKATPVFLIGKTLYGFNDQLPIAADFTKIFAEVRASQ